LRGGLEWCALTRHRSPHQLPAAQLALRRLVRGRR
jgi:hypothetical protein